MMKPLFVIFLFFSINCFGQLFTENLKIYYPFNGDLLDYSGNGYHATSGSFQLGQDQFFCDESALVSSRIQTSYNKFDTTFSCAFWLKINNATLNNVQISGRGPYFLVKNDSLILRYSYTTGTYQVASIVPINEWVHIAITYSRASDIGKLYVNGKVMQEAPLNASGALMYFGGQGVSFDEVYYFTRVLTEGEVENLAIGTNNCTVTSVNEKRSSETELYPNPNLDGLVYIQSKSKIIQAQLLDLKGQVKEIYYGDNIKTISVSEKGMMFLRLFSEEGNVHIKTVSFY